MEKNKKIGILTFHASHNCGSMLQAYALQEILREKYNCNVEIIDFSNKAQDGMYGYVDFRLKRGAIKNTIQRLKHIPTVRNTRKDYIEFYKDNFIVSKKHYSTSKQLDKDIENYDVIVSGGDQIWNIRCGDADLTYFLPFNKNVKKVSYSPSFGATNISKYTNDEEREIYKKLLSDYDSISIREFNGKKWIKELIGKEVPIVADPTMLINSDKWLDKIETLDVKGKYIFYYAFSYANKKNIEAIAKVSEETGYPVYVIDAVQYKNYNLEKYGFKLFKTGPVGFLSLMKNAEIVFSQSFHGTIFSALFHRNFWAFHNSVIANPDDDRATYILKQLGLLERYINIEKTENIDWFKSIDYEKVDEQIKKLQSYAFNYIEDNIIK